MLAYADVGEGKIIYSSIKFHVHDQTEVSPKNFDSTLSNMQGTGKAQENRNI